MSKKQNVVVVGGGALGSLAVQQLAAKIDHSKQNLILIDSRPYLLWVVAGARIVATENKEILETALVPFERLLAGGKGILKVGKVVAIKENDFNRGGEVVLENNESVSYDALILATGSSWPEAIRFPDSKEPFLDHVKQWRAKFKAATEVIIVGGGAVGIELAGEVRDQYPEKKITIVHGQPMLLNSTYPDKFRTYMEIKVRENNIDLVLGEHVASIPESGSGSITLRSGKTLHSDCIVQAIGPRPNTDFIASSLGPETLSPRGLVKVTSKLQLPSHPSIFAAGDIIEWQEQKQAAKAEHHVKALVPNVISFLAGEEPSAEYKGSYELIVVTIGKDSGATYLPFLWGIVIGPWFARLAKSRSLFIPMIRSRLGYS